eukprot:TRINITY_DN2618_c0_g1_i1.p1 TRINITY_DN2618_c0_g1~~TRINITY_DN2618_c0_g1_i1.p1  ORF type:complete len:534 (+),score=138.96 TRINITY_DN2618_c0_g1_i1:1145-2746(+)
MSSPKRGKSHAQGNSVSPTLRSRSLKSKRTIFHLEVTSTNTASKEKEKEKKVVTTEKKKIPPLTTTRSSPRKDKYKKDRKPNEIIPSFNLNEHKQVDDEILSGVSDTKGEDEDLEKISSSPIDWTPRLRNEKTVNNFNSRESSQDSQKDLAYHFENNIGILNSPPSRSPSFLSKLIPPPKNTQINSPYRPPLNTLTRTISPPLKRIKQEISPDKGINNESVVGIAIDLSNSHEKELSRSDTVCIIDPSSSSRRSDSLHKSDNNLNNTTHSSYAQQNTNVQGIESDVNRAIFQFNRDEDSMGNENSQYSSNSVNNNSVNNNNNNNSVSNNSNNTNRQGSGDPRMKLDFVQFDNDENSVNRSHESCETKAKGLESKISELKEQAIDYEQTITLLRSQCAEHQEAITKQKENFEESVANYLSRIEDLKQKQSHLEDRLSKSMKKTEQCVFRAEKAEREVSVLAKLLKTEVERAKRLEMQLLEKSYTTDNSNNNNISSSNNNVPCTSESEELEVLKDKVFMMEMQLAKSKMLWKKTR